MIDHIFTPIASIYVAFAFVTFGHFLRTGQNSPSRRVLQACISAAWPVYWLTIHEPRALVAYAGEFIIAVLRQIGRIIESDGFETVYTSGVVLVFGFYLIENWTPDAGWADRAICLAKGLMCGLAWPAYLTAVAVT